VDNPVFRRPVDKSLSQPPIPEDIEHSGSGPGGRPLFATDHNAFMVDARRVEASNYKMHTLSLLQSRHRRIIEYHVQGLKNEAIARLLNITPMAVQTCLGSPIAKERIRQLNEAREAEAMESIDRIAEMTADALDVVQQTIRGRVEIIDEEGNPTYQIPSVAHRLKAAESVLDRNQLTAKVATRRDAESGGALSEDLVAEIKQRYRDAIIDVTDTATESAPPCNFTGLTDALGET
jgi:predicted transcriptional regulator